MIQVNHHEKTPVNTRARIPVTAAPQSAHTTHHQKSEASTVVVIRAVFEGLIRFYCTHLNKNKCL